jgi:hypothetical protein
MYYFTILWIFFSQENKLNLPMQFIRPTVLFLALCFLLSTCSVFDCEHDQPITQDLDQWTPYQLNEELHFRTAAVVDEYLDVKLFERAWENADTDCTDDIEYIQVYITSRNTFDSLSINITNNTVKIGHETNFNVSYIEGLPGYTTSTESVMYHESMMIGGQNFSNVLVASCSGCNGLTEVKLSKLTGIVEYTYNGLVYSRVL